MIGIIGIVALLTVLGLSLLITRIATIALSMTGMSLDAARFQARSAFTGTGFTTQEAEAVVTHPVRRRIVMGLMLLRSAGIITVLLSLILSFAGTGEAERITRLLWLTGGVIGLWLLSLSNAFDPALRRAINWASARWRFLEVHDYVDSLHLGDEFVIREMLMEEDDWLVDQTLADAELDREGVLVLGIHRHNGDYVGAPRGSTEIEAGDRLTLYGRTTTLAELDNRRRGGSGDQAHDDAVDDQQRHEARETAREQKRKQDAATQDASGSIDDRPG